MAGRNELPNGASLPILRHQDQDLYYREHGDRYGIGSYAHRPMPVDLDELRQLRARRDQRTQHAVPAGLHPGGLPAAWEATKQLLPALRESEIEDGFNGIFSFTPDGGPLVGRVQGTRRLLGRRGGLGDPLGRHRPRRGRGARPRAVRDRPGRVRRPPLRGGAADPRATSARPASRTSSRSTTSCTRCSPGCLRATCASARSTPGTRSWAASSWRRGGWERPHWFEANAELLKEMPAEWQPPARDAWSGDVLLADRGRRSLEDPHRRGHVRHDPAQAARGHRARAL